MRNGKAAGALVLAHVLVVALAAGTADAQSRGRGGGGGGRSTQPAQGPGPSQTTLGGQGSAASVSGQPNGKYRLQPLNLHREALGTDAFATAARARMRNGDCAGALDDFDLALQTSTDPTLNRDRGLCHERLGDPYPAIDDYRVYVTAAPDAADAEGIRQRLARLEMDVYKHSSESTDAPDQPSPPGGSSASSTPVATATVSTTLTVGDEPKRDAMEEVEHDHDEVLSSIRGGTGFGLAPFFSEHKWNTPGSSFGDSTTWSESVGLQLRYSVSRSSAFFLEGGWELFNSTDVATISGLTSQLGYELRVPLDPRYNNQFLLGLGLGLEYLVATPKDVSTSGTSAAIFVPELRLGWRHMLTDSVGLDLALGFGITGKALSTGSFLQGAPGESTTVEILAANLGVVWGL
jgi:hypothetical protein